MIRQFSLVEPLSIYNFKFIFDHLVGQRVSKLHVQRKPESSTYNGSGSCYLP